jgi:hypothetical protein
MSERTYTPKQREKPTTDLRREFYAAGRGSSGAIKTASDAKDATGLTGVLDLEVPEGALWKLLRLVASGHDDIEFELATGEAGSEAVQLRGDAPTRTAAAVPLDGFPVREKDKVLVRIEPTTGPKRVKATLVYEELT